MLGLRHLVWAALTIVLLWYGLGPIALALADSLQFTAAIILGASSSRVFGNRNYNSANFERATSMHPDWEEFVFLDQIHRASQRQVITTDLDNWSGPATLRLFSSANDADAQR